MRDFGPKALKQVRQRMIQAGYVRTAINVHVCRIRTMFKWAVGEQFAPVEVWQALCAVSGLRRGRSDARESEPVEPVEDSVVQATLLHLPCVVADMVRLQRLTGARPGEVCTMRAGDITRGMDGVWTYRPERHKTEHHGKQRRIFIGPEGQAILAPYLDRDPDAYCFSPADSEAERNGRRRQERRSPMTPSQAERRPKGRRLRDPQEAGRSAPDLRAKSCITRKPMTTLVPRDESWWLRRFKFDADKVCRESIEFVRELMRK